MSRIFVDPRKVYNYFNSNFSVSESSSGWYSMKCPFCSELEYREKMAFHPHFGWAKCWVCQFSGSAINFVMDYENLTFKQAYCKLKDLQAPKVTFKIEKDNNFVESEVTLPVGFTPLMMGKGVLGKRARKYLEGRGFDIELLDRKGFGYCNVEAKESKECYFGYIIIPFYVYGKLSYYIGRDYTANWLRYKNPNKEQFGVGKADLWFNQDAFYLHDEVFCLEGAFDALTIGDQAASSQGWSWSKTQLNTLLKSPCSKICLVPDAGADNLGVSFYYKALKLAEKLIDHKEVKVLDLNVLGEKADVNSVGKKAVMDLHRKAETEDFCSILEKLMDYE